MSAKPQATPPATPLNAQALSRWQAEKADSHTFVVPTYDRTKLSSSIVHVGVGGFHRAHMAVYLDNLKREHHETKWSICGVGLVEVDRAMRDAMARQDCLYTVVERSQGGNRARIVGSMSAYLFAPEDPEAVIAKMAAPSTHIVSMTITESGYCQSEATGDLDHSHPDIAHDFAHPKTPKTLFGYLMLALGRRKAAGLKPFTVMSCDNMQQNGTMARRMLLSFIRHSDKELATWVETHGAFPNSMVDRITPRTTDADRKMVRETFGIEDAWPVVTEPFLQWVLEDNFCDGRPPWEKVGVQLVKDVEPYELMKLRLLNASHSAMGYLGYLCGHTYIHDVTLDPMFKAYVEGMMHKEVLPLLHEVPGIDLNVYCASIIERFANPTIMDQVSRICMHGSGKMPKFIIPSISEHLAKNSANIDRLTLCVAAWFRYLTGVDEAQKPFVVDDPMVAELTPLAKKGGADPSALLGHTGLFAPELRKNKVFCDKLGALLGSLYTHGARKTLKTFLETHPS